MQHDQRRTYRLWVDLRNNLHTAQVVEARSSNDADANPELLDLSKCEGHGTRSDGEEQIASALEKKRKPRRTHTAAGGPWQSGKARR